MSARLTLLLLGLQSFIAAAVLAAVAVAPPSEGAITVVPLLGQSEAETARWVLAHDVSLVGMERATGSIVAFGRRSDLALAGLASGFLVVRADPRLCMVRTEIRHGG